MPKNQVSDLITDQEITFARLVLSGTMTDRDAAQAAGLNPDTAAYTKAKPRVRAYMLEHRAAVQQQLVDQEAEEQRRKNLWRQRVLDRLWEIAALPAEVTRNSIAGQVKAISMIVAIEGLIPNRRASSSETKSAPPRSQADINPAAWLGPHPDPALIDEDNANLPEAEPGNGSAEDTPPGITPRPVFDRESISPNGFRFSETTPSAPHAAGVVSAPDARVPFSIKKNPFARRR